MLNAVLNENKNCNIKEQREGQIEGNNQININNENTINE